VPPRGILSMQIMAPRPPPCLSDRHQLCTRIPALVGESVRTALTVDKAKHGQVSQYRAEG
jgi:hypothetical protein